MIDNRINALHNDISLAQTMQIDFELTYDKSGIYLDLQVMVEKEMNTPHDEIGLAHIM